MSAALKPDMADELSAFISATSNAAIAEDWRSPISAALKPDIADELSAFMSDASNAAIAED